MKKHSFTIWEKQIIGQAISALPGASIGEIETLLEAKKAFELTDEEKKSDIDSEVEIKIPAADLQLIWSKMQTLKGFPVDERTLNLKKKMEAINGEA